MPRATIPGRAMALLEAIGRAEVERLPPAERQRLADQCERVHRLVMVEAIAKDARKATARGVLAHLKDGERSE